MAQDLSDLTSESLGAESMAATSTVASNTAGTAPGSESQQSRGAVAGSPLLDVSTYAAPNVDPDDVAGSDPAAGDAARWKRAGDGELGGPWTRAGE